MLAPLSDMFQFTCLTTASNAPVLQPHPHDSCDEHDPSRLPSCFTKPAISAHAELHSLLLVASGSVMLQSQGQSSQEYSAGEWMNGSSLLRGNTAATAAPHTPSQVPSCA